MNRQNKETAIDAIKALTNDAHSIVAFDYSGSTVKQLSDLRNMARQQSVTVLVVRNRLASIALAGTKFEELSVAFKGATMLAVAHESPSSSAKVLKAFIKENSHIVVKGLSVGEGNMTADQLDVVASMPTRDEALSILARTLTSPAQSLAAGLNDGVSKLARALKARSEQLN
jgi:large subunit ribosomal protein L10